MKPSIQIIFLYPLILLWSIIFGAIVGFVGGVVWTIEKTQSLIGSNKVLKDNDPLYLKIVKGCLITYIAFFSCFIAGIVCAFIGPGRAYTRAISKFRDDSDGFVVEKVKANGQKIVLIVDDEKELAGYIAQKIESTSNYKTVQAYNGLQAFKVLEKYERFFGIAKNKVECIVLDIKMPEMNGIQFLQELRKQEGSLMFKDSGSFHQMPVIILSAYEDIDKINDTTHPKLGKTVKYIMKPESEEQYNELLTTIDNVFTRDNQDMISSTYLNSNYRMDELRRQEATSEAGTIENFT